MWRKYKEWAEISNVFVFSDMDSRDDGCVVAGFYCFFDKTAVV